MGVRRIVRTLLPLVLVLGWFVALGPTQLGGPAAYVIVDGTSMEPTYQDGDLVITRQRSSYEVGDIVAFVAADSFDSGYRVIHRLVEVSPDGYRAQGDNRDERDPWTLTDGDIIGASVLRLPRIGTALTLLRTSPLLLGAFFGVVAFVLMLPRREAARREPSRDDRVEFTTEPPR